MKSLILLAIFSLVSLSSCEKALDRSYKRATDKAGEEKEKQAEIEEAAKARELLEEVSLYCDLNAMAANAGIDYPALLERALRKDKDAVVKLLWMAGDPNLDGAGSEGYSYTMVRAARLIGDQDVSEAAKSLSDASRSALRTRFLFEFGEGNDAGRAVEDMQKDFPLLWALIGEL